MLALYRKSPVPLDVSVWAAALHVLGLSLLGDDEQENEGIPEKYGVEAEAVNNAVIHMKRIETDLFNLK